MGKREWPKGWGGLCFPHCRSLHTLFTYLAPDIVFLDKEYKILKIIPAVGSWRVLRGPVGCLHSLELRAGTVKKLNLKKGKFIQF